MTTNKFAALAADVSQLFKVELIDPITDKPIEDKEGRKAFVEVLSLESPEGLAFDKEQRSVYRRKQMKSRNGQAEPSDSLEENQRKLAALTRGWHLVDPATREVMDVPCSVENAFELYSSPGLNWIYTPVFVEAANAANFMKRASVNSSTTPSTPSAGAAI